MARIIPVRPPISLPSPIIAGAGTINFNPSDGFYPTGHWDPADFDLRVVYPRPDGETNTWARHHWAYYDGVNPTPVFEIDLGALGGAWPYVFEKVTGPSGMTVGSIYSDPNYKLLTWTPDGDYTNEPVHYRAIDQEGTVVNIQFTVSTTDDFIFISNSGDDENDGSYNSPVQTPERLFGLTQGAMTDFPNARVYFRGGTYLWYDQGNGFGVQMRKDRTPMTLLAFPGETVVHDISNSGTVGWLSCSSSDGDDIYLRGFEFTGSNGSSNFRYINFGDDCDRVVAGRMNLPSVFSGSSPGDNATFAFFPGTLTRRQYPYIHHIVEEGRTGSNSGAAFTAFSCQYMLAEYCTATNSNGGFDFHFKDSILDSEIRECFTDNSTGMQCQLTWGEFDRVQFRHTRVRGGVEINNGYSGTGVKHVVVNRCSVLGLNGNPNASHTKPDPSTLFEFRNNAIQSPAGYNPVQYDRLNTSLPAWVTNTGTQCQGTNTSSIINETTMNLIGVSRTNHYGTAASRGAEIA